MRVLSAIRSFLEPITGLQRLFVVLFALFFAVLLLLGTLAALYQAWASFKFDSASSAEHLRRAREACRILGDAQFSRCVNPSIAVRELGAIPATAPEYRVASIGLAALHHQLESDAAAAKEQEDASRDRSYQQAQRNFSGSAHDAFSCAMSAENKPIISFDGEHYWWLDDGHCSERLQRTKDESAQPMSFWPTTLRVDTDIDASWLPNEERICTSYPGHKGEISRVACDSNGSHRGHNIPIKFWGGTERARQSSWKCRRDNDEFVCRAVDWKLLPVWGRNASTAYVLQQTS